MKKILFTLICLQSVFTFGQAPAIEWQRIYGGSLEDWASSIKQTSDGGYVFSSIARSNDGDVGGNYGGAGYEDAWIVKVNATGIIEWEQNYGGTSSDVIEVINQTSDGGYIVAGSSWSTSGDVVNNQGFSDGWIMKLDGSGSITWKKSYGGSSYDRFNDILQTSDGYIVLGSTTSNDGNVSGNHGVVDVWVLKINTSGNIIWNKCYGGTMSENAQSIQQTSDGGYIFAGFTASNNGDVSGKIGTTGVADVWIVKINGTGTIEWQKCIGGTSDEQAISIQQTTDGGYILGGYSKSNDVNLSINFGNYDIWIVKLNVVGTIEWEKSIGGSDADYLYAIRQTSDGGYIMVGDTKSIDGDISVNHGEYDLWCAKLNSSGVVSWQKTFGGTLYDGGRDIQQTTDGGFIIVGTALSSDGDVVGNKGGRDIWVIKLEGSCSPVSHTISETACTSFTWTAGDGETYTSSTSVSHTFVGGATNGCDSIVTLNLTINQPTSSSVSITECGSYTWSENNQTYTSTGSYTHVVPNANNCDSTITLNLTINQSTSSSVSVTECGSYTWSENNQTYTSTGSYTHVIPNVNNCDSTITLNLTINNVDNTVSVSGITLTANQAGASYQWLDCDNGNTPISGETAQSLEPTANGNYAVEVTANGCTETSNCVAINSVGVELLEQNGCNVYPNPNDGLFTINSTQTFNNAVVEIYSAVGQLVYSAVHSGDKITINLNEQPTGIYILKVNNQQNLRVIKL